jgi:ribosomal protein S12 methylthiotransferase accessory factor YcaO
VIGAGSPRQTRAVLRTNHCSSPKRHVANRVSVNEKKVLMSAIEARTEQQHSWLCLRELSSEQEMFVAWNPSTRPSEPISGSGFWP